MGKNPAKTPKEQPSYDIRDVVLAKVRGFPPWPGMVVDPESVPQTVSKERPSTKKTTFYCVRFFPAGDYAWLVSKDISKLQTHEIESYINEPFKRSGDLLKGYRIALDPRKWEEETAALGAAAVEEEANAEVDELDSEKEGGNDGESKKPKSKKRKRDSEAAGEKKPSKPKAKKERKDSTEPASGKKKGASEKGKAGKKKSLSKATIESEDDADNAEAEGEDDDAGPSKKTSPPPTKKPKKDKEGKDGEEDVDPAVANDPEAVKVREWRHKIQKAFLSPKSVPKDEDMPGLDQLFKAVEQYDKICIQYLTFSKIGKVMRHIAALSSDKVPRDEEFKFRDRAQVLVNQWHQILHQPNGNEAANGSSDAGKDKVNGTTAKDDGVVESTAAIDLNKQDAPMETAVAPAGEGDLTVIADVTMSED